MTESTAGLAWLTLDAAPYGLTALWVPFVRIFLPKALKQDFGRRYIICGADRGAFTGMPTEAVRAV